MLYSPKVVPLNGTCRPISSASTRGVSGSVGISKSGCAGIGACVGVPDAPDVCTAPEVRVAPKACAGSEPGAGGAAWVTVEDRSSEARLLPLIPDTPSNDIFAFLSEILLITYDSARPVPTREH